MGRPLGRHRNYFGERTVRGLVLWPGIYSQVLDCAEESCALRERLKLGL